MSDGGYLSDPDGEHAQILNPDAVSSAELGCIPCLILLGEQGIGKSTAIRKANVQLTFDLGGYASDHSLTQDVFLNPHIVAWLHSTDTLTLALDSLDEGRGAIDNLVKVLLRELRKIQPRAHRLLLRIGCRTADWPSTLEDGLRDIWGENAVCAYQLAPLRRTDVCVAAEANAVDAPSFIAELDRREAVPFAIKPITLQFLLTCFKKDMRFPSSRTALYLDGCRGLCEESDERRDAGFAGNLSADQRVGMAARIAALTMFGGFSAVWNGADGGIVPDGDISIRELCGGVERIQGIDIPINEHAVREVLRTGLFSANGRNELRWSHYSYSEFLAARYLADRKFTTSQVMSLLSLPDDREGKLAPQLHETAAWLASMRPEFFRILMEADPGVLLLSDVATADPADRANLVETLLKLYDEERLLDAGWGRHALYRKLAHPGLAEQLTPYIDDASKGPVVRRVAIDIADACELHSLQIHLAGVALDTSQDLSTRVQAAYALTRIGDPMTKVRLKPLAIEPQLEDVQDELKGCASRALWPHSLSGDEMFGALTQRKMESFGGAYCQFLVSTLPKGIQKSDVPPALRWLSRQRTRRELETCFQNVSDLVMKLVWENLFDAAVVDAFVDVIAMRLRTHDGIFGNYREASEDVFPTDDSRRRLVVERLLPRLSGGEIRFLPWSIPHTGRGKDFLWILERYQSCTANTLKEKWLKLVVDLFRPSDQIHLEAVLAAASDGVLAQAVAPCIATVELGSPEAIALRKAYEESEKLHREIENTGKRPLLTPSPAERIAHFLDRFEQGDMDAWWRLHMQMTLEPNSTHYGNDSEPDLTALPGWKASGIELRQRILSAAKKYLQDGLAREEEWLGKNVWFRSAMAGYTACLLLLQEDPDSLRAFGGTVWKKWAPAVLAYSTTFTRGGRDLSALNQELLALASSSARPEIIRAILTLIDHENDTSEHLHVTQKLAECWDIELSDVLITKCQDQRLKPVFVGALLELLLQHGHTAARSFAASLVPPPAR